MDGLKDRQMIMVDFCVRRWNLLSGAKGDRVWLVPGEKSPPFVRSLTPDRMPAATPKGRFVVCSKRLQRVSLITVPEYAHAQGLHLADFLDTNLEAYQELLATSSHIKMCRLIGASAGTFSIANWLLKRHRDFCKDESPEQHAVRWANP